MAASVSVLNAPRFAYLKPDDAVLLENAYRFSTAAHEGQMRQSGEPYISHPLAVAEILAGWRLDGQALIAALLHDVTEDTQVTKDEIAVTFGKPVAELVDGVSKLDRIQFESAEDAQAENFRKMLLAMARDVRVILIKLADRLHNMRTLSAVSPEKRRRIARETMEIYAPIALRLGLNMLYHELQELAFANLHPFRHQILVKATRAARGNRREVLGKTEAAIKARLAEAGVEAEVSGREKHLYSIYKKMVEKHLSFSEVHDIYGFRVIVRDVAACYLALGALHALYKPIPGKFKDYIAIPKANGYQSLHTRLLDPYGLPVEVQIRTASMHRFAQSGVASHWMYKGEDASLSDLQKQTHRWLQSLIDIQDQTGDSADFLRDIKIDLFPDEVYVFTPKGRILSLPRGATPVDFAYAVHTDVGNRCVAARVNGELVSLRSELRSGEQVEIITASHAKPNPVWLQYVRTGKARANIRHFLRTMQYDESAALGERLLAQAVHALARTPAEIDDASWERVLRDSGTRTRKEVYADIGIGRRLAAVVARRLLRHTEPPREDPGNGSPASSVVIRGTEGAAVQLARCCRPIPGDAVVGSLKKGQGLIVHTVDCRLIAHSRRAEPAQWIEIDWDPETGRRFQVAISVTVANERGVLAKVASGIAEAGSNIESISMDEDRAVYATMHFVIDVANRQHLARVMRALRRLRETKRISRLRE